MTRRNAESLLWDDETSDNPLTDARDLSERERGVMYPSWRDAGKTTRYAEPTKTCKRCGIEQDCGAYGVFKLKSGDYAPRGICLNCERERKRRWVEDNRERHNALAREWQRANRDKVNVYKRRYRERNRERIRQSVRAYRLTRAVQRAGLLKDKAA